MNKKFKKFLLLMLMLLVISIIAPRTINAEETSVSIKEANKLIERWLSSEQVDQIELKALDDKEYNQEIFKLRSSSNDSIIIEATSTSSLSMRWHWYMK